MLLLIVSIRTALKKILACHTNSVNCWAFQKTKLIKLESFGLNITAVVQFSPSVDRLGKILQPDSLFFPLVVGM